MSAGGENKVGRHRVGRVSQCPQQRSYTQDKKDKIDGVSESI